jgi:hypothetical protein
MRRVRSSISLQFFPATSTVLLLVIGASRGVSGSISRTASRANRGAWGDDGGRYFYCPNGSHLLMYDDQKMYMDGVVHFIHDVDEGCFWQALPREV